MKTKTIVIATFGASAAAAVGAGVFYAINLNIQLPPIPAAPPPQITVIMQSPQASLDAERERVNKSYDDEIAMLRSKGLLK
jgi:hypothetical protein